MGALSCTESVAPDMQEGMFASEPLHRDTFRLGQRSGSIAVWFGRVPDVREAGYDILFGRGLELQNETVVARFAGFPAILVRVETSGRGYANWLGWIQLVRESALDGPDSNAEVDPIWYLRDKDVPFASMGYSPNFFDAPSRGERHPVRWEADLYLCTVPAVAEPELEPDLVIRPLCGVRWGFKIPREGAEPELSFPRQSPADVWSSHSKVLSARFPSWNFQR